MASTNKTATIALNQWVATDPVLRDDFNADNLKIDSSIAEILAKGGLSVEYGTYIGDGQVLGTGGKEYMSLVFDFEPQIVILDQEAAENRTRSIMCRGFIKSTACSSNNYAIALTWGSNYVRWAPGSSTTAAVNFNSSSIKYYYLAIGKEWS